MPLFTRSMVSSECVCEISAQNSSFCVCPFKCKWAAAPPPFRRRWSFTRIISLIQNLRNNQQQDFRHTWTFLRHGLSCCIVRVACTVMFEVSTIPEVFIRQRSHVLVNSVQCRLCSTTEHFQAVLDLLPLCKNWFHC